MDNSPLLYLCPDISDTIGEYLKTYKNNQKIKKEFHYLLNRSLIKNFNIRCKEISYDYYLNKHNDFLYKIPPRGWVWMGDKRYGSSTKNFYIQRTSKYEGIICTCMNKCNYHYCHGSKLKLLRFPRNILNLRNQGYYNIKLFLNELPK